MPKITYTKTEVGQILGESGSNHFKRRLDELMRNAKTDSEKKEAVRILQEEIANFGRFMREMLDKV